MACVLQAAMGVVNSGLRPELPASTPPGLAKLVRACWSASPEERPSFVEIQAQLACMMKEAERQERQQGGINNAAAAAAANNACVGAALLSPGQLA